MSHRTLRRSRVRSVPSHPGSARGAQAAATGKRVPGSSSARSRDLAGEGTKHKTARMLRRATRRSSWQSSACGPGIPRPWHLAGQGCGGNNCSSTNNCCSCYKPNKRILFKGIHVCLQPSCFLKRGKDSQPVGKESRNLKRSFNCLCGICDENREWHQEGDSNSEGRLASRY